MKKTLLGLSLIAFSLIGKAQNCSDLIISEYVEGTGNDKALEIYNPTMNSINTNNNYRLVRYNNGTGTAAGEANNQAMINLGAHTIHSGEAWVIVLDKRNPAGIGNELPVTAPLQAMADTFLCPDYNVSYALYFNGNDAVSLQKFNGSSWVYVDIFGKMGDAAMTTAFGWSDAFPYDGSAGEIWTENQTLLRKSSVQDGVKSNPSTFIVTNEWDSLPRNTFSNLGTHSCTCPTQVGINELSKSSVKVNAFPNPITNSVFTIEAEEVIESIKLYNLLGDLVLDRVYTRSDKKVIVNTDNKLSNGVYYVRVSCSNSKDAIVKISIQ